MGRYASDRLDAKEAAALISQNRRQQNTK